MSLRKRLASEDTRPEDSHEVKQTELDRLMIKLNKNYNRRRYLSIVSGKKSVDEVSADDDDPLLGGGVSPPEPPPPPIRPERSRRVVEGLLGAAHMNRAPECRLYLAAEAKFLCVALDVQTGKHKVQLLEPSRFFPSPDCGRWRVLPADRNSRDKRLLLQSCFSNKYLGHDLLGMARADQTVPTEYEHLELVVDRATGYLQIVCPHWHWGRGAPFVVKGPGKRQPQLWPAEAAFLERCGAGEHSENPPRTLRLGYAGREDKSAAALSVPALFQVVYDLPARSRRPAAGHAALGEAAHVELNWLAQSTVDFSAHQNRHDPTWRSPHKARVLGLIP